MAEASAAGTGAAVAAHRFFCHFCKGEVNPKLPVRAPRPCPRPEVPEGVRSAPQPPDIGLPNPAAHCSLAAAARSLSALPAAGRATCPVPPLSCPAPPPSFPSLAGSPLTTLPSVFFLNISTYGLIFLTKHRFAVPLICAFIGCFPVCSDRGWDWQPWPWAGCSIQPTAPPAGLPPSSFFFTWLLLTVTAPRPPPPLSAALTFLYFLFHPPPPIFGESEQRIDKHSPFPVVSGAEAGRSWGGRGLDSGLAGSGESENSGGRMTRGRPPASRPPLKEMA